MIWSLALAAGGVLGLYLAGRKNLWGWAIGLAMQGLWIAYAIVTTQYGFLLSAAAYGLRPQPDALAPRRGAAQASALRPVRSVPV